MSVTTAVGLDALPSGEALDHLGRAGAAVTVAFGGTVLGTAALSVSTVSHEPPLLIVALDPAGRVPTALDSVGGFALNLFEESPGEFAGRFVAGEDNRLGGMRFVAGNAGQPLLVEAAAQLECSVREAGSLGELRVFTAEVSEAWARAGASLGAVDGELRSFVASRDDATYQEMRGAILERRFPVEAEIVVDEAVERLGVERANVTYALARLTQEGLVTRRSGDRYAITPVDEALISTLLHAREILMVGIVDSLIDSLTEAELAAVAEAAAATRRPAGASDVGMENDRSVQVFRTFNETVVGLAGNSVLLDTYRRLSVPTVMGRVLWRLEWSTLHDELSERALELAAGVAARDRPRAVRAIRSFNECVHDYAVGVLRSTGGRL